MRRRLPQKQMVERGVLWMVRRLCNANHNSRVLLQLCLTMLHGSTDGAGDAGKHAGVVTASVEDMGGQVGAVLCMEPNSCGCVKAFLCRMDVDAISGTEYGMLPATRHCCLVPCA